MAKSKAPVGYRSVMYALFTIAGDVVTYEAPKPIIAAKSMTATDNFASGDDYGDDILQESIDELQSTTLSIVFRSIPREIEAALQGHNYENGAMNIVPGEDIQKGVAILCEKRYSDGSADRIVYYNCKMKKEADNADGKTDAITFGTETLSGKAIPLVLESKTYFKYVLESDKVAEVGAEENKKKYDAFFTKVQFADVAAS